MTRGHQFKLKKRYSRTATRHHFFSYFFGYRVVDSGNELPSAVVNSPTVNNFKNAWAKSGSPTNSEPTSNSHFHTIKLVLKT